MIEPFNVWLTTFFNGIVEVSAMMVEHPLYKMFFGLILLTLVIRIYQILS